MKFYGKAESVGQEILKSFESGNIPSALADVFIHRKDAIPCRSWSWANQLHVWCMSKENDARGFKQWGEVGRKVKAGSHAIHILAPCMKKIEDKEDENGDKKKSSILYGFRGVPVFRIEDTEISDIEKWEESRKDAIQAENWINSLPIVDVAREWGLKLDTYNASEHGARGYYMPGREIMLGTENLSTWAHEMIHAADDRLVKLRGGQDPVQEIVAELGGAILLECLGYKIESDRGGCFEYIKSYAGRDNAKAISTAMKLLDRTCKAVDLILDTAASLKEKLVAA